MTVRAERLRHLLLGLAGNFLSAQSNRSSMITVTDVTITGRLDRATIFFTVLPEHKGQSALDFAKRNRGDFRDYVKSHAKLKRLPTFDFALDQGEKNRQRMDELSDK